MNFHLLNLKQIFMRGSLLPRHPGVDLVDVIDLHQVTLLILLERLLDQAVARVQLHVECEETLGVMEVMFKSLGQLLGS